MKEETEKRSGMCYPASTLYVGDLSGAVHEGDLVQAFGGFPGFSAAKLCRDHISGNSLCYAYINFETQPQAESAMRAMNHMELMGKPMRIMWIKRDPYSRKTGVGNLYVKNLELLVSAADLERVFSQYGSVLSCKVVYDKSSGRSMRFGFVQMCSEKVAQEAISALHGSNSCLSKSLYVAKFVRKGGKKKNLYIKNLEGGITSKDLRSKFSQFGQVASAIVMEDKKGNSRRFGFVSFEQNQDAESALSAMNGATWGSRAVYVGFAQKKAEREALLKQQFTGREQQKIIVTGGKKRYELYVGNLEESVNSEDLRQLFESCGTVILANVVLDLSKRSRGFGFVHLSTLKGLLSALSMDGMSILKGRPIKVKRAYPKRSHNKCAITTKSTAPSSAAPGAVVQPSSCRVYPDIPFMDMCNKQPPTLHNLRTSDSRAAPSPISAPVYYYDPGMHCVQPLHAPASAQGTGPSHRALSLTPPVKGAHSNPGKRAVARAKTEDTTEPPARMVLKCNATPACADLFQESPIKTTVVV